MLALALCGGLLGGGCVATTTPPSPVAATVPPPDEQAPLEWARGEEYFVVVRRSCRTVSVYKHGDWVRTYRDVAFGRNPGIKNQEGDKRTPRGLYKIIGRRWHPRWERFLLIDYPNLNDVDVHREAWERGEATARPGSQVGIHGTDEPILNEAGVDWTYGCIALMNKDVRELYSMVPDGTLVLIDD